VRQLVGRPEGMDDQEWLDLGIALGSWAHQAYRKLLGCKPGAELKVAQIALDFALDHYALYRLACAEEDGDEMTYDEAHECCLSLIRMNVGLGMDDMFEDDDDD
jgi:hypothetical protein